MYKNSQEETIKTELINDLLNHYGSHKGRQLKSKTGQLQQNICTKKHIQKVIRRAKYLINHMT